MKNPKNFTETVAFDFAEKIVAKLDEKASVRGQLICKLTPALLLREYCSDENTVEKLFRTTRAEIEKKLDAVKKFAIVDFVRRSVFEIEINISIEKLPDARG